MSLAETKVIFLKETALQSVISDTWAYGCLAGLFWFNHQFIDGSYLVNTLILIMIALKIGNLYKGKTRYTIEEARTYLDELENSHKPPSQGFE